MKTATKGQMQGLVVATTPIYRTHRTRLANSAEKNRLPAVYDDRELVDAGGLMSTKFELIVNLKTAKQIGLTIPPNVLLRADKVIKSRNQ